MLFRSFPPQRHAKHRYCVSYRPHAHAQQSNALPMRSFLCVASALLIQSLPAQIKAFRFRRYSILGTSSAFQHPSNQCLSFPFNAFFGLLLQIIALRVCALPCRHISVRLIAIAGLVRSARCLRCPKPFFASAMQRIAMRGFSFAHRSLTLSSQCFARPSYCKTKRFNAFPQRRIA
jgi:hypothetical protein